jgi:hypothetical protein
MTHLAQRDLTDEPLPATTEPASSSWIRRLRLANRDDEAEFLRLFRAWAGENGIDDFDDGKVRERFSRAVRRDRSALVVVDEFTSLVGFVMLGYAYPWFASDARMSVLTAFTDPAWRDTPAARALAKFAAQPLAQLGRCIEQIARCQ